MKMLLVDGDQLDEFNLIEGNTYDVIDSIHKSLYSVYINNGETIYLAKSRFKPIRTTSTLEGCIMQSIGDNEC